MKIYVVDRKLGLIASDNSDASAIVDHLWSVLSAKKHNGDFETYTAGAASPKGNVKTHDRQTSTAEYEKTHPNEHSGRGNAKPPEMVHVVENNRRW